MRLSLLAGAALLLTASPALSAASLAGGTSADIPWLRLIGALALCLGLAAAAVFALRHRQGATGGLPALWKPRARDASPPRLVETGALRLSNNVQLALFTIDGEPWIAATSPQGQVSLVRCGEQAS
ncbi:hypothetical protein [Brevundimonas faecalis]|uniref:Uncharacterized protein n=1 Tax=Brevundimonas faecalis TaxID=947378 RepID=A0ABV2R7I9_9CAUL